MEPRVLLSASPAGDLPNELSAIHVAAPRPQAVEPITWVGSGSGDWDVASNWSGDTVPGPSDTVDITQTGITITVDAGAQSVQSLTSSANITVAGGSLTLTDNSQITGALTVNGSRLTTNATLTASGGTTLESFGTLAGTGTLAISGTSTITNTFTLNAALNNSGTLTFSSGNLNFASGVALTNENGGILDLSGGVSVLAPGVLANAGTINNTAGVSTISATFNNTAAVNVTGGTFGIINSGTSSGTFNASAGATVEFYASPNGDNYQIAPGSAWNGAGLYLVTSFATVTLNASTVSVSPENFELDSNSTATGPGSLTIPSGGVFTWNGGEMSGTGVTTIDANATLNSGGVDDALDTRTIDNSGTINFSSTDVGVYNNAPIINKMGATFTFANSTLDGGAVQNDGTFTSSGSSSLLGSFTSSGTVDSTTGNLSISSGSSTGTFDASSGASISLASYTANGGTAWNDAGTYVITGYVDIEQNVVLSPESLSIPGSGTLDGLGTLTIPSGGSVTTTGLPLLEGAGVTNLSEGATWQGDFQLNARLFNNYGVLTASDVDEESGGVLSNQATGIINMNPNGNGISEISARGTVENLGVINFDVGSEGSSIDAILNNNGTLNVSNGELDITAVNQTGQSSGGGIFQANAGASIVFDTDYQLNPGSQFNGTGAFVINSGTLDLSDASINLSPENFTIAGSITGPGSLAADSGAVWTANGGTVSTGGSLYVAPGGTINFPLSLTLSGTTFENRGTVNLTGGPFILQLGAVLNNDAGGVVDIAGDVGPLDSSGQINNDGTFERTAGTSSIRIFDPFNNAGTVDVAASEIELFSAAQVSADKTTLTGGTWIVSGGGVLAIDSTKGQDYFGNPVSTITTNDANVTIDGATSQLVPFGNLSVNNGTLRLLDGASLTAQQMIPENPTPTVNPGGPAPGPLENTGTIELGEGSVLNVTTDFTQTSTGTLITHISGSSASGQFGRVQVTGAANLDGAFTVELDNSFVPAIGDSYPLLTYASQSGDFASFNGVQPLFTPAEGSSSFNLQVTAAPSDLAAVSISPQGSVVSGQNLTVSYEVTNQSAVAADSNEWTDSLYLSLTPTFDPTTAVLLGRATHTGGLGANASYTGSLTTVVPPVLPGSYFLILSVDSQGQVADSNLADNFIATASPVPVTATALTPGSAMSGNVSNGEDLLYQVDLPAGSGRITLSSAQAGLAEVYIGAGGVPSAGNSQAYVFDASSTTQTVTFDTGQGGEYYILVHGREGAGTGSGFEVEADALALSLDDVQPIQAASGGSVTLTINGADLSASTGISLLPSGGGTALVPDQVVLRDSTALVATFNLAGVAPGSYSLVATEGGDTETLPGALTVVPASALDTQVQPILALSVPSKIRAPNLPAQLYITYSNPSAVDIPAPLLILSTDNASFQLNPGDGLASDFIEILAVGPAGSLNVLPPGYRGVLAVTYLPETFGPHVPISFDLQAYDYSAPIDQAGLEYEARPPGQFTDAQWAPIQAQLLAQVGPTYANYQQILGADAALLPSVLGDNEDLYDLLQIEVQKAIAATNTSISGMAVSTDPTVNLAGQTVEAENTTTGDIFTTTSLNNGSFVFSQVSPGNYTLLFENALVSNPTTTVAPGQALTGVTLNLTAGAQLSGTVTAAENGAALAGVTIYAEGSLGTDYTAITSANGTYSFTGMVPDTYQIDTTLDGRARTVLPAVTVSAGAPTVENFALTQAAVISGTVAQAPGGPGGEIDVTAVLEGSTDLEAAFAATIANGTYTFDQLPAGTYDLQFDSDGYISTSVTGIAVAAGQSVAGGNETLALGATISGTVASNDPNNPAPGASVSAYSGTQLIASGVADTNGDFTIAGLAPGTYSIQANTQSGFSNLGEATVVAGQDATGVSLLIQPGAAISGVVENSLDHSILAGVNVYLSNGNGTVLSATTDTTGAYSFTGLALGSYQVYLADNGPESSANATVTSLTGQQITENLSLSIVARLTGSLSNSDQSPVVGGSVDLYSSGQLIDTALTDDNGNYQFLLTAGGTFDLQASSSSSSFAPVTGVVITPGQNVTENFTSGNLAVQVSVTDTPGQAPNDLVQIYQVGANGNVLVGQTNPDANGNVTFGDLVAGQYQITVNGNPGFGAAGSVALSPGGGNHLALPVAALTTLSGTIQDGSGNLLNGASVVLTTTGGGGSSFVATTGTNGTYQISAIPNGTYDLTAFANGQAATILGSITINGNLTENVMLSPSTTSITGTLVDGAGLPIANGTVTVQDAAGHTLGLATSAPNGAFTITTASGSNLSLLASLPGYAANAPMSFTAPTGATTALGNIALTAETLSGLPAMAPTLPSLQPADAAPTGQNWLNTILNFAAEVEKQLRGYTQTISPPGACSNLLGSYTLLLHEIQVRNEQILRVEALRVIVTADTTLTLGHFADYAAALYNLVNPLGQEFSAAKPLFDEIFEALKGKGLNLEGISQVLEQLQGIATNFANASAAGDYSSSKSAFNEALGAVGELLQLVGSLGANIAQAAFSQTEKAGVNFVTNTLPGLISGGLSPVQSGLLAPTGNLSLLGTLNQVFTVLNKFGGLVSLYSKAQAINEQLDLSNEHELELQHQSNQVFAVADRIEIEIKNYNTALAKEMGVKCPPIGTPRPHKPPGTGPISSGGTQEIEPGDPNDISGPTGYGPAQFVAGSSVLPYQISFENMASATAPAQTVVVTDSLDPNLDLSTFELGTIGFAGLTFTVPAGLSSYDVLLDTAATLGVDVQVDASLDFQTRTVTWTLSSIDPKTGDLTTNPVAGFLAPDTAPPVGEAFLDYTIQPLASDPTGTVISAQASVVFDTQPAMSTPVVSNTLDAVAPSSRVNVLPAKSGPDFTLTWGGQDDPGGSGLQSHTIYESINNGAYQPLLSGTTLTSTEFTGIVGDTYSFYSLATDNVGNVQSAPIQPDATVMIVPGTTTTVVSGHPFKFVDANGNPVTVTLTGPGSAVASLVYEAANDEDLRSLVLSNTTAATNVTITVTRLTGKSGETEVGRITTSGSDESVGTIALGPGVTMGDGYDDGVVNVSITGGAKALDFGALANNAQIVVGSGLTSAQAARTAPSISIGSEIGFGTSITSDAGFGAIELKASFDGAISATDDIGPVTIVGALTGSINGAAIGNIKATALGGAIVEAQKGNIGAISATAGGIVSSSIQAAAGAIGNIIAEETNAAGTTGAISTDLFVAEAIGAVTATISSKTGQVALFAIGDTVFTATKGNIGNITATVTGPTGLTAAQGIEGTTFDSEAGAIGNVTARVTSPSASAALVGIGGSNFTAGTSIGSITASVLSTAAAPTAGGSAIGIEADSDSGTIQFKAGTSIKSITVSAGGAGGDDVGLSAAVTDRIQFSAGSTVGTVLVSVSPGKAKSAVAYALDHVDLTAGGAIGRVSVGGDATATQVADFQVYAGGSIAGLDVTSKLAGDGSVTGSTFLAGQAQAIKNSAGLAVAGLGFVTISGSLMGGAAIGAQGNIGAVTIGNAFQSSQVVAGINAGPDHLPFTSDDTYNDAASILSVTVSGDFSDSSIVAGVSPGTSAVFGTGANPEGTAIAGLKTTSKIGAITLGAATLSTSKTDIFLSPAAADQTSAIESLGLTSIKIGKLPVVKNFTVPVWIDANGDGNEESNETLIRVVS